MILVFRETDGVTGDRLTFGHGVIDDGDLLKRDGRVIIGVTGTEISPTIVHNLTTGKQGGQANQYYHLTALEYSGNWGAKNLITTGSMTATNFVTASNIGIAGDLDLIQLTAPNRIQFNGNVGIGAAPIAAAQLYVFNNAINVATSYQGIQSTFVKTGGATDLNDNFYGGFLSFEMNQVGGTVGRVCGFLGLAVLTNGTIDASEDLIGGLYTGRMTGGTNSGNVFGVRGVVESNGGTVGKDAAAGYFFLDQSGGGTINDDAMAIWARGDFDGTVVGDAMILFLQEQSNVDFCIYQSGSAPSRLGGDLQIDSDTTFVIYGRSQDAGDNFNGTDLIRDYDLLNNGGVDYRVEQTGDSRFTIIAGTGEVLIDATGQVGIGTTNPDALLHIEKESDGGDVKFRIANSAGTGSTDETATIGFMTGSDADVDSARIIAGRDGAMVWAATHKGNLQFHVANSGVPTEAMRITSAGDVGIGTTSPDALLHIEKESDGGDVKFRIANSAGTGSTDETATIGFMTGSDADVDSARIIAGRDGAMVWAATHKGNLQFHVANAGVPTEAMRITSAGNVGIMYTAPVERFVVYQPDSAAVFMQVGNVTTGIGATNGLYIGYTAAETAYVANFYNSNLNLSVNGTDRFKITSGTGNIEIDTSGYLRANTARYRRYYHLALASFDPGNSGATWQDADGNQLCGWKLDADTEVLMFSTDCHSGDWDAASDLIVEVHFSINNASGLGNELDWELDVFMKGTGETVTKNQTLLETTVLGVQAQFTKFTQSFTIDYDDVGDPVDPGDDLCFVLRILETAEITDIRVTGASYHYNKTHVGLESGDT